MPIGLGKVLIGCAVDRCLKARKQVAAFALLVDAKNAQVKSFLRRLRVHGVRRLTDDALPATGLIWVQVQLRWVRILNGSSAAIAVLHKFNLPTRYRTLASYVISAGPGPETVVMNFS